MRLPDAVVAEYEERALRAAGILGVEKRKYDRAVEACKQAQKDYDAAKGPAEDAEHALWAARNGWVPLKDGTWLSGTYASAHPDVLRDQYLYELEEE